MLVQRWRHGDKYELLGITLEFKRILKLWSHEAWAKDPEAESADANLTFSSELALSDQ